MQSEIRTILFVRNEKRNLSYLAICQTCKFAIFLNEKKTTILRVKYVVSDLLDKFTLNNTDLDLKGILWMPRTLLLLRFVGKYLVIQ